MVNDKFGIKMLYPTIPSADDVPKSWFISDGFKNDDRVRLDESVSGNNTDGYKLSSNAKVRFTISADDKDVDIGCENNFADSTRRGYVYKKNDWMAKANSGVEMTAFFKMTNIDESDSSVKGNPIIMKGPTGEHHSDTDCCSGSAHMVHISGSGENWKNNFAMRLSKEMWHVHYITLSDYKTFSGFNSSFLNMGWVGFKYIIYKKTVNNVKSVVIEVYVNANADKQTWTKLITKVDSGGWGDGGKDCNGNDADSLVFGNARMMFRWDHRDGSDVKFKNISIRPVDPNGDFDEDPVVPDTQTEASSSFRAFLKLKRSINSYLSPCDSGGQTIFYEIPWTTNKIARDISNTPEDDYRSAVAQRANPSGGSSMTGKTPKTALFELIKIGTPAGNVNCKIWNSAGTVKFTSPSVSANSLPTTYDGVYTSFDLSSNTYTIQNGDRLGISYTGTDPNNLIQIQAREPGDGSTGTYYAWYDDNINTWNNITGRDLCCQFLA